MTTSPGSAVTFSFPTIPVTADPMAVHGKKPW
jgi:hypothetical protein